MLAGPVEVQQSNTASKAVLAAVAVFLAILIFHDSLIELVTRWNRQEEYSHGFLIPFVVAWLLWTRRDALRRSIGQPSWAGPVLIVFATAMHVVGELSSFFFFSQFAFLVVLTGIVLGLGGYSLLKVTMIPTIFLGFSIPLPYFVDSDLSWRLQLVSSQLGVSFIRLFQIPVYLEGNVIDLGIYKLQVVDACSGLRYLYPFLSLGFLAAYLFHASIWARALVFLSTVPITIVMNSLRIAIVGVLVDHWGPQQADGLLHMFEGWVIFIACAVLLALEIYLLARIVYGKSFFGIFYPPTVEPALSKHERKPASLKRSMAYLSFVLIAGVVALFVTNRQEIIPDRTSFVKFPASLGEWRGRASSLEPQIEHGLGLTDYILSDYRKSDGRQVNLYIAYYESQRKGVSPHSPSVCIPGNGWQITEFLRTSYHDAEKNLTLPFNRVVIGKDSTRQLVYYWFEQRGRKIENEWWSKWYLLTDAISKNRTDGALIRLTTPLYPNETMSAADQRIQTFIRDLLPTLNGYLPAEPSSVVKSAQNSTQTRKF